MKKQSYFKKFAAVAMAAVMTFAFTACGSNDAGTESRRWQTAENSATITLQETENKRRSSYRQ